MRKLLDPLLAAIGYTRQPKTEPTAPMSFGRRDFAAALQSRLTNDWSAGGGTADAEIRAGHKIMRQRWRDLRRNNDYVRRYHKLLKNNVLGANGIGMQSKIREMRQDKGGLWVEQYDTRANKIVEDQWWAWGKRGQCTVSRALSWVGAQGIVLDSAAGDGACLVRFHYPEWSTFRFALEIIEIDRLDTDYTARLPNGEFISLGVHYGSAGEVKGFYLLRNHPGENAVPRNTLGPAREFVPARDMLHVFDPDRPDQSTGYTWGASTVNRLKQLGAYEEAEVVAARMGASKMGFLEKAPGTATPYTGAQDSDGNKYMEVEPGSIEELPVGMTFKPYDPTHPNSAFTDFVKATLRGISAGLGVSYTSLANDLESVNFSSIRAGLLEEREEWKRIQGWFIESFIEPVFERWLQQALLVKALTDGQLTLPMTKFDKFNSPEWKPRRWPWVDPLKDMQASVLAVDRGYTSRRAVIAEAGGDIEAVDADQAADAALDEQYGLDFKPESPQQANKQQQTPDDPDDPEPSKKPARSKRENPNHDPQNGQFASGGGSGGGGGSSSSGGSGPSGGSSRPERLRDRIEGTQAEADNAVKKATQKVEQIKQKIETVKAKAENSAAKAKVESLESSYKQAQAKTASLKQSMAESDARISALKAKLAALKGKK